MNLRLKELRKKWSNNYDAFLLYKPENLKLEDLKYISNFSGSTGFFIQTKKQDILIADGRYFERAKKEKFKEIKLISLANNKAMEIIEDIFLKNKTKKVLIEDYLPISFFQLFKKNFKNIKLDVERGIISSLRAKKDEGEIFLLKKAQKITDNIFKDILSFLKLNKHSEKDLELFIYQEAIKYGCDELSFDPIIASGVNSAIPHHKTSNKKITNGPLLIDFGVKYNNYVSDMTRTIWIGNNPSQEFLKVYEIVLLAQNKAIEKCHFKDVVWTKLIDQSARDVIDKSEFKNKFIHSTGHGIGLDIHEAPFLNSFSEDILSGNEVITIEPGIYLEGKFGIRIEDVIIIGKGENITKSEKGLIRLW